MLELSKSEQLSVDLSLSPASYFQIEGRRLAWVGAAHVSS